MSGIETTGAAVITVLTLVSLTAAQILAVRRRSSAPRWLNVVSVALVVAFAAAMYLRLSTAL